MKLSIVPSKSSESYLIQRITSENKFERMPPANRDLVTPEEIRLLRMWIDQGADWPEKTDTPPVADQLFKKDLAWIILNSVSTTMVLNAV